MYKISSSDVTYLDLIRTVASTGKPIIISTGCSTVGEIEAALEAARQRGNEQLILQHCILQYPCEDANANLAKMVKLQEIFPEVAVGYSDHTYGSIVPAAAVAMGACTIEKHFTIDKKLPDSPDHPFSADPAELKELSTYIRRIEAARGSYVNGHYPAEEKAWRYARKSLVSVCHIPRGTVITHEMLTCKRPGTGIYPEFIDFVVGGVAKVDIEADTTIARSMVG